MGTTCSSFDFRFKAPLLSRTEHDLIQVMKHYTHCRLVTPLRLDSLGYDLCPLKKKKYYHSFEPREAEKKIWSSCYSCFIINNSLNTQCLCFASLLLRSMDSFLHFLEIFEYYPFNRPVDYNVENLMITASIFLFSRIVVLLLLPQSGFTDTLPHYY